MATLAGLKKEVVLLGVQDHVEIWSARRWESYLDQQQGHYDEVAETALSDPVTRGSSSGKRE